MFHRNPLRGFGAPGGRNLPIPITLAIGFYNSLHYRASRDEEALYQNLKFLSPFILDLKAKMEHKDGQKYVELVTLETFFRTKWTPC